MYKTVTTQNEWATYEVGTEKYPCIGPAQPPRNIGQLAQMIVDFSDDWTHEELCREIASFTMGVKDGKI